MTTLNKSCQPLACAALGTTLAALHLVSATFVPINGTPSTVSWTAEADDDDDDAISPELDDELDRRRELHRKGEGLSDEVVRRKA